MGHNEKHHHYRDLHHQAVDGLANLFSKANHDLNAVQFRLEKEFQQIFPDNVNPIKLMARIKKLQDDLLSLKELCRELLLAKQDLIDKTRNTLVENRKSLQQLQASVGIPLTSDTDDPAFTNFNQVIDEWRIQVRSSTGDTNHESGSDDINQLLFSAIIQGN